MFHRDLLYCLPRHLVVLLDRTELFGWRGSGDLLLIGGRAVIGDGDDVVVSE